MEILNSWKEIASYLGRGVRTVQRWEHDLGLPVHRPKGKDRSAVLAFPHELDAWLHNTPVRSLSFRGLAPSNWNPPKTEGNVPHRRCKAGDVLGNCARSRELLTAITAAARRQQALTAALCGNLDKLARARPVRSAASRARSFPLGAA